MMRNQQELDAVLDRTHILPVTISSEGPLPDENAVYNPIRVLAQTGFSFTPRELLHAIGCKTAALPTSPRDECLKAAWLFTYILDLEGPYLAFRGRYGADLQIARSQEVGIGILCLIAERCFGIPWDQLGPLPGLGMRFDYRGETSNLRCIFEAKGTSRRATQTSQIRNGLEKKAAHHARGEQFDVELIVSSCIEHSGHRPRIILADPDRSSFKNAYERGDNRYFRLKHYCRVLQYIGLPRSAYHLNRFACDYLNKRMSVRQTVWSEKNDMGYLQSVVIEGDEFLGRWFDNWLPFGSERYKGLYDRTSEFQYAPSMRQRSVFQGVRRDIYESGLKPFPFSNPMIEEQERRKYHRVDQRGVSVFSDGTVMIFRQG